MCFVVFGNYAVWKADASDAMDWHSWQACRGVMGRGMMISARKLDQLEAGDIPFPLQRPGFQRADPSHGTLNLLARLVDSHQLSGQCRIH